jgi:hypothetical protein
MPLGNWVRPAWITVPWPASSKAGIRRTGCGLLLSSPRAVRPAGAAALAFTGVPVPGQACSAGRCSRSAPLPYEIELGRVGMWRILEDELNGTRRQAPNQTLGRRRTNRECAVLSTAQRNLHGCKSLFGLIASRVTVHGPKVGMTVGPGRRQNANPPSRPTQVRFRQGGCRCLQRS